MATKREVPKPSAVTIDSSEYQISLLRFINYHNQETNLKQTRDWALAYAKRTGKDTALLGKASDHELRQIGVLGHAVIKDQYLSLDHIALIDTKIDDLIDKYKTRVEKPKPTKAQPTQQDIEDKNTALFIKYRGEVDAAIDDYILDDVPFNMKAFIATNSISAPVARMIAQSFRGLFEELREAAEGKDEQLKEAYSYLGKVKLKRYLALVQQIIADCQQQTVNAKAPQKPRVRKERPASVQVGKMKYLKEFPALNLKSVNPAEIIGASEVWLYDTAKRKLCVYRAVDGQKLGVKGTTLLNWDVETSGSKTLRKPEVFFAGSLAKKAINTSFKEIKATVQKVYGRTNDDLIIVRVY